MDDKKTNKNVTSFEFDISPSDSEKTTAGDGFIMTPSETEEAPKESPKAPDLEMSPTPAKDSVPKVDMVMAPEPVSPKKSEGEEITLKASEPKDSAEELEKDFSKMDEAPMKEAMRARDDALRSSVDSATSSTSGSSSAAAAGSVSRSSADLSAESTSRGSAAAPAGSASRDIADSYAGTPSRTGADSYAGSTSRAGADSYAGSTSRAGADSYAGGTQRSSYSGGSHYAAEPVKPKKEKKYVRRGTLIGCMILTMILSTLLGSLLAGGFRAGGNNGETERAKREDSKLSELNLSDATGSKLTVAEIVDKNEDAVVEIIVSGTTQGMWGQMQLTEGAGSGVIIREDGYIATNYHVIQGANKVEVTLHNGDAYPATIVGSDPSNDVAVVKIDEKGLTTAEIGDSSTVDVGDLAVAIGNPLGQLGGSVTTGIISALDRVLTVEGTTLTLLQTDAAINGGNSGGGLFNARGELIGIVESKAAAVGVEGLGFALPINNVAEILNNIIDSGGDVNTQAAGTPAVGVVISDVSEEQAQYYGFSEPGVYIAQVTGRNAQEAGFREADRVVSFNGTKVNNSSEFITLVRKCKVGDTVTVVVSRDGQEIEIKTVLEELQTQQ